MPGGAAAIADLLDRQSAVAVAIAYASALDAREWTAIRALFGANVTIDYSAIGSLKADVSSDEWTARCRLLEAFGATAHRLSNLQASVEGKQAEVAAIVDAAHFIRDGEDELMGNLIGRYRFRLQRGERWSIVGVTLSDAGYPAGRAAFDRVFALARTRFAQGASA